MELDNAVHACAYHRSGYTPRPLTLKGGTVTEDLSCKGFAKQNEARKERLPGIAKSENEKVKNDRFGSRKVRGRMERR